MAGSNTLVCCGLHRSGTTFVGELLKRAGINVVHEPLNEKFGMCDVPVAYPYVGASGGSYAALVDDAIQMSRAWNKDTSFLKAQGIRRKIFQITGGKSGLKWGWLRLCAASGIKKGPVCFKDPFMSLATPYLVGHHRLRVVCLVRHPAAIHYSTMRQKWNFDATNLLRQRELMAKYGEGIPDSHWELARSNPAASIALLWKLMVRINFPLSVRDEKLLLVTHEEFCMHPVKVSERVFFHLGVPFDSKVEQYIRDMSSGERALPEAGKVHSFKRNAKALASAWRGRLPADDERIIYELAGEEIAEFYS